ncbi:hypothetical protein BIFGAL_02856 [Bifidobacterium gallicum DSM 20093 = LMG 11596]|uniref:Uncharacterized protein n=1 Tax=Bifidobacterium gallicum DSM 20093 = LMG 11596 TaxID=561180 RepID=D1NSU6_9BIFI|nr:hypothetical protein BIFGAL_02856 [Bifidobacterium gallicum DSM 20093 = LMG 11596]
MHTIACNNIRRTLIHAGLIIIAGVLGVSLSACGGTATDAATVWRTSVTYRWMLRA